jgi:hypothetical protein
MDRQSSESSRHEETGRGVERAEQIEKNRGEEKMSNRNRTRDWKSLYGPLLAASLLLGLATRASASSITSAGEDPTAEAYTTAAAGNGGDSTTVLTDDTEPPPSQTTPEPGTVFLFATGLLFVLRRTCWRPATPGDRQARRVPAAKLEKRRKEWAGQYAGNRKEEFPRGIPFALDGLPTAA